MFLAKSLLRLHLAPLSFVLSLSLAGCESQNSTPAAPAVPPGTIKAEDAKGVWNQSQVQEYLTKELKLASLSLKSTGNNGYQGTAKGQDGQVYTLEVKQAPGGIKTQWTTSTGGSGKLSFGNPVP